MTIIEEIREKQSQLIMTINTTFDAIIRKVENLESNNEIPMNPYVSIYPLATCTTFKGKKPLAVSFNNKKFTTPTWKSVVQAILQEIIKDTEMKNRILALRNHLLGRVRNRISETSDNMRSPLCLCENLYIETHYDTKMLLDLLLQILNEIHYDYSRINVTIKN